MPTGQPNGIRSSCDESYEVRLFSEIVTVQSNAYGLAVDWDAIAGGVKDGLQSRHISANYPSYLPSSSSPKHPSSTHTPTQPQNTSPKRNRA